MLCVGSRVALCDPVDCGPSGSSVHGDSPDKNIGVGCHALLQEIFPIQGSNPGLPHCWWILCHLSHQESPYIYNFILPIFGCAGTSLLLRLFSSCDEWGPLFLAVCRAPHWGGFSCCGARALGHVGFRSGRRASWAPARRRGSCGAQTQ